MKSIYLLFSILILTFASCTIDEKYQSNQPNLIGKSNFDSKNNIDKSCLTYRNKFRNSSTKIVLYTQSRSSYVSIEIEGSILKRTGSSVASASIITIPSDKINTLNLLFSNLSLAQLPNYLAPSTNHRFDGAPSEMLSIEHNEQIYISQAYDAGNSPSQIKDFIDFVKSL
ncbi:MAG: hypothetical protein QM535_02630 [Limnohabitans sp.]|nr:hypothetical protein [Limnohabitans sp.]